jgi:hypothetical protein
MEDLLNERRHVINLLKKSKILAQKEKSGKIKELSDKTVHSASVYQDDISIYVAIVIYALSKIMERGEPYYKENYVSYVSYYLKLIDKLIFYLENKKEEEFKSEIKNILKSKEISKDFKEHLSGLFSKARLNKASKIYEHGISMKKTARLMGVSLWELAEYSGGSSLSEMEHNKTEDVKKRMKNLEEIFK